MIKIISDKGCNSENAENSYRLTTTKSSPIKKWAEDLIDISPKKTSGQQAYEKMLNITSN